MSRVRVRHGSISSGIGTIVVVFCIAALAAAPWWVEPAYLPLLAEIYAYVALASLWNLLAGYTGLISLGQQAYVGLGAYLLFGLTTWGGLHPYAAIPFAGVIAAAVAVPVAALLLRVGRPSFVVTTWIVAEVFRLLMVQSGTAAITIEPAPGIMGLVLYWMALGLAAVILLAVVWLLRSRYGLAFAAIQEKEVAARSNGVDPQRIRYAIYVAVAFATAMVGALIFLQKSQMSAAAAFSFNDWTVSVIIIAVIGGIGRVEGPIIGAAVFFLLRQVLGGFGPIFLVVLGLLAVAGMLWAPKGVWGALADRFGWQVFPLRRRLVIGR